MILHDLHVHISHLFPTKAAIIAAPIYTTWMSDTLWPRSVLPRDTPEDLQQFQLLTMCSLIAVNHSAWFRTPPQKKHRELLICGVQTNLDRHRRNRGTKAHSYQTHRDPPREIPELTSDTMIWAESNLSSLWGAHPGFFWRHYINYMIERNGRPTLQVWENDHILS